MRVFTSKRQKVTLIIIVIWIAFGIFGISYGSNLAELALYFSSLTAFVGAYIWGETKRPSGGSDVKSDTD